MFIEVPGGTVKHALGFDHNHQGDRRSHHRPAPHDRRHIPVGSCQRPCGGTLPRRSPGANRASLPEAMPGQLVLNPVPLLTPRSWVYQALQRAQVRRAGSWASFLRIWWTPYRDRTVRARRKIILIRSPAASIAGRQLICLLHCEVDFKPPDVFIEACLICQDPVP
jgi:hypothetical protein